MSWSRPAILSLIVIASFLLLLSKPSYNSSHVTLTLQPGTRFQTIEGWGATTINWHLDANKRNIDNPVLSWSSPNPIPDELEAQVFDDAVFEFGLNRLRFETGPHFEPVNDDGDPNHINWSGFKTKIYDRYIQEVILPFKQRVESRGEPFVMYISYSFAAGPNDLIINSPDEYAEFATALLAYLKDNYGLTAKYWVVYNEPTNGAPVSASKIGEIIKKVGPRLQARGFPTKIQYPEEVGISTAVSYINQLLADRAVWPHVGVLSYHLYGGGSRSEVRSLSQILGIPAAQTEKIGAGLNELYLDLTEANASAWEKYVLYAADPSASYYSIPFDWGCFCMKGSSASLSPGYWELRQVFRYVRPGSVRIGISSPDPAIRPMAFIAPDGRYIVIAINASMASRDIQVAGLPAGSYEVALTVPGQSGRQLPSQSVQAGGSLAFQIPAQGVVTFAATRSRASNPWPHTLHFAQFANGVFDGGSFASALILTNPSPTSTARGEVSLFADNGSPMSVAFKELGGVPSSSFEFAIPPLGSVTFTSDGQGAGVAGFARVASDSPVSGVVVFSFPAYGASGVGESIALSAFIVPVARKSALGLNTGIAIADVSTMGATVELTLRNSTGQPVENGETTISLGPNGHIAKFIGGANSFFPNADTNDFRGTLTARVVTAGAEIAASAFQLGPGQFTTLPVSRLR